MRVMLSLVLLCSFSAAAHQIFFLSMEESLFFSDAVVIAEIEYTVLFPMDSGERFEYGIQVLESVYGPDSLEHSFIADYTMLYPMSWIDEDGNEVWESPIVNGSGLEGSVVKGDTVLAFLGYIPDGQGAPVEIVRIEPADSLDRVLDLMERNGIQ